MNTIMDYHALLVQNARTSHALNPDIVVANLE